MTVAIAAPEPADRHAGRWSSRRISLGYIAVAGSVSRAFNVLELWKGPWNRVE